MTGKKRKPTATINPTASRLTQTLATTSRVAYLVQVGHKLEQRIIWEMLQGEFALARVARVGLAEHSMAVTWDDLKSTSGKSHAVIGVPLTEATFDTSKLISCQKAEGFRYLSRLERGPNIGLDVGTSRGGPDICLHVLNPAEDLLVGEAMQGPWSKAGADPVANCFAVTRLAKDAS